MSAAPLMRNPQVGGDGIFHHVAHENSPVWRAFAAGVSAMGPPSFHRVQMKRGVFPIRPAPAGHAPTAWTHTGKSSTKLCARSPATSARFCAGFCRRGFQRGETGALGTAVPRLFPLLTASRAVCARPCARLPPASRGPCPHSRRCAGQNWPAAGRRQRRGAVPIRAGRGNAPPASATNLSRLKWGVKPLAHGVVPGAGFCTHLPAGRPSADRPGRAPGVEVPLDDFPRDGEGRLRVRPWRRQIPHSWSHTARPCR